MSHLSQVDLFDDVELRAPALVFDQQRAPERALTHLPEHLVLIHHSDEDDEDDGLLLLDGQDARERERRVTIATRQQRHLTASLRSVFCFIELSKLQNSTASPSHIYTFCKYKFRQF